VAPVLARNYIAGGVELLEVIACRPLDDDFGLYNGDVLVEDFRESAPEGVHQVQIYVMTREGADWKFFGATNEPRLDCNELEGGWVDGVNERFAETAARPDPGNGPRLWEPLPEE